MPNDGLPGCGSCIAGVALGRGKLKAPVAPCAGGTAAVALGATNVKDGALPDCGCCIAGVTLDCGKLKAPVAACAGGTATVALGPEM